MHNTCINSLVDLIPSLDDMDRIPSDTTDHAKVSAPSTTNQDVTNMSLEEALANGGLVTADGTDQTVHADDDISIDWDVPHQHKPDTTEDLLNFETDATTIGEIVAFSHLISGNADLNEQRQDSVPVATIINETVTSSAITNKPLTTEQRTGVLDDVHGAETDIEITESTADFADESQQQPAAEQPMSHNGHNPEQRAPSVEELYVGVPCKRLELVSNGDHIVRVIEFDYSSPPAKDNGMSPIKMVEEYQVSKAAVKAASKVLAIQIAELLHSALELRGDLCKAVGLWLRGIHKLPIPIDFPVDMCELRHALVTGDRYRLGPHALYSWYSQWVHNYQVDGEIRPWLLYPCFVMDHAESFASLTRDIVYTTPHHISESQPRGLYNDQFLPPSLFHQLQSQFVPHRIVGALNAARGRLRTILTWGIFNPLDVLLDSKCDCKDKTLFAYTKALHVCGVWPLENAFKKHSISTILRDLSKFNFIRPFLDPCNICRRSWNKKIVQTVAHVRDHFEGLCLDCINETNVTVHYHGFPKQGPQNKFSSTCRVSHGDCSQYHSEMARKDSRYDRSGHGDRRVGGLGKPDFDVMEEEDLGLSGLFNTDNAEGMDTLPDQTSSNSPPTGRKRRRADGANFEANTDDQEIDGFGRAKRRSVVDDVRRAGLNESTFTTPSPAFRSQKRGHTDDDMDVDETPGAKRPRTRYTKSIPVTPRGRGGRGRGSRGSTRGGGFTQTWRWT